MCLCKYTCTHRETHTWTHTHLVFGSMYVEVRRHITGLDFLLASCRLQGSKSGHQACSRQLLPLTPPSLS